MLNIKIMSHVYSSIGTEHSIARKMMAILQLALLFVSFFLIKYL